MADETRTDPSRGYSGSPEAHDFVRSPSSLKAEQERIRELADKAQREGQKPRGPDAEELSKRIAKLESAVAQGGRRHDFNRFPDVTLTTWLNSCVQYIEVKSIR